MHSLFSRGPAPCQRDQILQGDLLRAPAEQQCQQGELPIGIAGQVDEGRAEAKPFDEGIPTEQSLEETLRRCLMSIDDPEVLAQLKVSGFYAAEPEDYEMVRIGMKAAEGFLEP